jgi:Protein kinase domain
MSRGLKAPLLDGDQAIPPFRDTDKAILPHQDVSSKAALPLRDSCKAIPPLRASGKAMPPLKASGKAIPPLQNSGKAIPSRDGGKAIRGSLQSIDKAISPQNNSKTISLQNVEKAISLRNIGNENAISLENKVKVMSLHDCDALDHGDILNSDDEEFDELFEYTEGDQVYHRDSGLYFPICIGDVLNQRYCIEHKLGHGSYSTVWLAHDIQKKRAVALKIIVSGDAGENEYNIQKEIIRTVKDTSNFLTYLTTFTLPGYKGNHRVLVFPVRGSSLEYSRWDVSVATRMSGARQLLKSLECLHNAGIVHQGD